MTGIDTAFYYRLSNAALGAQQALDVRSDGSGYLQMAQAADVSGQHWRLVDLGGAYALRTWYLGDALSLALDEANRPRMVDTSDAAGQRWTLTRGADGTYRVTNVALGSAEALGTAPQGNEPRMSTADDPSQHWTLTQTSQVWPNLPIPALDPGSNTEPWEAPTDTAFYRETTGAVKVVMVFVDFENAPATKEASVVAQHLIGQGPALYAAQSYDQMSIDVWNRADLEWRRMPKPSTDYSFGTFEDHKAYVADAASLFPKSDVDFSEFQCVCVVAPEDSGFDLSPALTARRGEGAPSPSGEIDFAITFGKDSYTNNYVNMVHELGHVFGLPDLYAFSGGFGYVGCWGLMSDIFHSVSFLGWHRHKCGWLSQERKAFIPHDSTDWHVTLGRLSGAYGVSMAVVPVDDVAKPSKVFVVELAEPVVGTDGTRHGGGVLFYLVDAQVATGQGPIQVIPKSTDPSPIYGDLYQAPFGMGDTVTKTVDGTSVELEVLQKFGKAYNLRITVSR